MVVYSTSDKPIITAHCSLVLCSTIAHKQDKGQDLTIGIDLLFYTNKHQQRLQTVGKMAKQFNDLLLKKMLITENESHLMRSIWLLNPCYCVSIREKLSNSPQLYKQRKSFNQGGITRLYSHKTYCRTSTAQNQCRIVKGIVTFP